MLGRVEQGDPQATEDLWALVYGELRKLAAAKMNHEAAGMTLQPTALVHEAWLRLGGDHQPEWNNRAHFFAAAAESMRRILIDCARHRHARRHGGGLERVNVEDFELAAPDNDEELLAVHENLERFAVHDARKAELVKLRYFGGLTLEEAAAVLGISVPTAKRDWAFARAWLYEEISRGRRP
jgi:RNA polymerase sigma factor (TIGR02999 family)